MQAEIITIGDELLIGQVIDTNSAWMAQRLNLIGIKVHQITSVSDSRPHIIEALNEASKRAELIFITGGLGPTKDDITKKVLSEYFQSPLVVNEEVASHVKGLLAKRGIKMNSQNDKQAEVLACAKVIHNSCGSAPGMWVENNSKVFVSMPGVPFEMMEMMENEILPLLKGHFKVPFIVHKTFNTQGIAESHLAQLIEKWEGQIPMNFKLAYLPYPGIVKLRLSGTGDNEIELNQKVKQLSNELYQLIGEFIFGEGEETLQKVIGKLLKISHKSLSTAESCTGGNIAHLITSVSGSSDYFIGSVIAYSNQIKIEVLGVNDELIRSHGAVSREVVMAMADGLRKLFHSDFTIATSGIAGPTGGTADKPVGTTWISVSSEKKTIANVFLLGENRERNIEKASVIALNMLRKFILEDTSII
jgi:nicotinamide-nucleotide amidase